MSDGTGIKYADATWKVVAGCSRVPPGCTNCFAVRNSGRLAHNPNPSESLRCTSEIRCLPERLDWPLRRKKPLRIFVCDIADLFHPAVPDGFIDRVFAVMALCQRHTFQVLTKRPERLLAYVSDPQTPFRVARVIDAQHVVQETIGLAEDIRPIDDYPGYFVSNHGAVYSANGSSRCPFCGGEVVGIAKRKYCSKKCRNNAEFYRRTGRPSIAEKFAPTLKAMVPDDGKQGYLRVMLYRDGKPFRELVHRLVLSAFVRPPMSSEQACHLDGNPRNNVLPNLRWGDQSENWQDRKRHGTHRSYSKLTDDQVERIRQQHRAGVSVTALSAEHGVSETQIRNIVSGQQWSVPTVIEWPLPNCWAGVTCENQEQADRRIPILLQVPAVVHWVSLDPLLGPIELRSDWLQPMHRCWYVDGTMVETPIISKPRLDWIVCGGETGPGARPMHPNWVRSLRDQCLAAGVPFFLKQMGEYVLASDDPGTRDGTDWIGYQGAWFRRIGKTRAGALLDGQEWRQLPEAANR